MAPRAERLSSTDFGKFVKRRQDGLGRVVVDLRPSSDFHREHFVGATSIPAGELESRLLELPPPFAEPLNIVGNEEVRASWLKLWLYQYDTSYGYLFVTQKRRHGGTCVLVGLLREMYVTLLCKTTVVLIVVPGKH